MNKLLLPLTLSLLAINATAHTLEFDTDPRAAELSVADKSYDNGQVRITDRVLKDGLGREAVLRGWNISGETKIAEAGFKPFKNLDDAKAALRDLRARTGANVIRFLISWEGVNPQVDSIDATYLAAVTEQIREATQLGMHVLVDWHEDLFSRHLFNADSWHTGNGAPAWVIRGGDYPQEYCGIICAHWGQNNLTNEAIRRAARNFWNNSTIATSNGTRTMQEAFLWQMDQALRHLKANLSPQEFGYILGVDPWNEPIDGGMEGLTPAQWDNQKLWPFYRKVRALMDGNGWYDKPVYAEPLVFWNTTVGIVAPATGGHHLSEIPTRGFVFNSHFYDAGRQGTDLRPVNNGSYLTHLHQVRDEARYLRMPSFLSEFGMFLNGTGQKDTNRTIAAIYQGMESSDALKPAKDRFADAYSPPVSGTQWHWDWYHDRHHEVMNGNPNKVITSGDAWNEENFSAITVLADGSVRENFDHRNIARVYPRRAQGEIMAFHYNALAHSAWNEPLNWLALRPVIGDQEYFRNDRWALLVWRGRQSEAPTELFLPAEFSGDAIAVVTDQLVRTGLSERSTPTHEANEILLTSDNAGGRRLLVWDDVDSGEGTNSWHYALVVRRDSGEATDLARLTRLQQELNRTLVTGKLSPVYFTGTMTDGGYVDDTPPKPVRLDGYSYQFLWWKYATFWWDGATGDVDIYVNGQKVQTGAAKDTRTAWYYSGETRYQVCERGGRRCSNVWTVR